MMTRALGPEKAENVLARIIPTQDACQIDLLDWLEPGDVASIIEKEHPQVAALLIANLDPAVGAKVLELLPDVMQPDIMHRIARLGPITPEAVEMLNALLAVRPSTRQQPAGFVLGGTREVAKIMSSARKATGERVMPTLAKIDRTEERRGGKAGVSK